MDPPPQPPPAPPPSERSLNTKERGSRVSEQGNDKKTIALTSILGTRPAKFFFQLVIFIFILIFYFYTRTTPRHQQSHLNLTGNFGKLPDFRFRCKESQIPRAPPRPHSRSICKLGSPLRTSTDKTSCSCPPGGGGTVISLPLPTPTVTSHLKKVSFKSTGPNSQLPPHPSVVPQPPPPPSSCSLYYLPHTLTSLSRPTHRDTHADTPTLPHSWLNVFSLFIVCTEAHQSIISLSHNEALDLCTPCDQPLLGGGGSH